MSYSLFIYPLKVHGKLASRLTLSANNNISILNKSCGVEKFTSESNLANHSFALNKGIKFIPNLATENNKSRLEIRKSSSFMPSNAEEIQEKIWEFVPARMLLLFTAFEQLLLFCNCVYFQ